MITLTVELQEVDAHIVTKYHAEENATTSAAEKRELLVLVERLQKGVALDGGRGQFVEGWRDSD